MKTYKDLIVWQKAMELVELVYQFINKLPPEENFGLKSQMRRAAIAIPSNIAEGFCRGGRAEFRQFLQIAFASGAELETQLEIAKNIGILQERDYTILMSKLDEIMRMLNKMITNIRNDQKKTSS